jgi:hypothetical protein
MAKVERNVITPPNAHFQNLEARRSDTPRAFAPSPHLAKAQAQTGGFAPGGSADLSLRKSPVSPNVNRFNVSEAAMPQPPASVEPGTTPSGFDEHP